MFDEVPEFAIHGERGIDLFLRFDDAGQKRARYRCIATLGKTGLLDHTPEDRRDPVRLIALAKGLDGDPLAAPLSLTDATTWSAVTQTGSPIRVFLLLDFMRSWQVAEMAAARFEAGLVRDLSSLPTEGSKLAGAVAPLFDFNRLSRGVSLARLILTPLATRVAAPDFRRADAGDTGFALRMLGDLCLRHGEAELALRCFETSIATGDNPFRRRRAIEAARSAGDAEALSRHRTAYKLHWPLPADLAEDSP